MHDEHEPLDAELERLSHSLRAGEHMLACLQLAEFALKLDHCIRCEERALALAPTPSSPLTKIRNEHASLRRLVALIASALDRADDRRGLEVLGKLRSVLLLHIVKEQALHIRPSLDIHAIGRNVSKPTRDREPGACRAARPSSRPPARSRFRRSGGIHRGATSMRNIEPDIIVTETDLQRLLPVLEQHATDASDSLESELHRAVVVDSRSVPADVVTMNSEVVYEDCETFVQRSVRIVYPRDADASRNQISVLAPIGSALLGLRVGQSIEWQLPTGMKRVRVLEIRYQPEACGDFER